MMPSPGKNCLAALKGRLSGSGGWRRWALTGGLGVLAALAVAARASGSLIIGLALIDGRIDVDAALEASGLDDRWQNEKWGEDPETRKRQDALRDEMQAAADFLKLVQGREGP